MTNIDVFFGRTARTHVQEFGRLKPDNGRRSQHRSRRIDLNRVLVVTPGAPGEHRTNWSKRRTACLGSLPCRTARAGEMRRVALEMGERQGRTSKVTPKNCKHGIRPGARRTERSARVLCPTGAGPEATPSSAEMSRPPSRERPQIPGRRANSGRTDDQCRLESCIDGMLKGQSASHVRKGVPGPQSHTIR